MAKADWCTVAPMSGNGDGTLTISAPAHTGRTQRSTTVTVQAQNGTKPSATIQVSQASPGIILTMDSIRPDVPKEGETINIVGSSNMPFLHCEVGVWDAVKDSFIMALIAPGFVERTIQINGQEITDYAFDVPGDPGASGAFEFRINLSFPQSPFPQDITVGVRVSDKPKTGSSAMNTSKMCIFTWKAGASRVSVSKSSLPIPDGAGSDAVDITSNDEWAVS